MRAVLGRARRVGPPAPCWAMRAVLGHRRRVGWRGL